MEEIQNGNHPKLLCFDVETTGLDRTKDKIIQFAAIKYDFVTGDIIDSMNEYVKPIGPYSIALGAYFKHGINTEKLADKQTILDLAPKIVNLFDDVEFILTFNGNGFDIPFLKTELNSVGYDIDFMTKHCYDAFLEEKRRNGNNLESTFLRYTNKTMEEFGLNAHDAFSDIKATFEVFKNQQKIAKYEPEKMYGEDNVICNMMFRNEIVPCFNIGKYRGISLDLIKEIDSTYLKWCVSDKCNFMKSTKEFISKYIK